MGIIDIEIHPQTVIHWILEKNIYIALKFPYYYLLLSYF